MLASLICLPLVLMIVAYSQTSDFHAPNQVRVREEERLNEVKRRLLFLDHDSKKPTNRIQDGAIKSSNSIQDGAKKSSNNIQEEEEEANKVNNGPFEPPQQNKLDEFDKSDVINYQLLSSNKRDPSEQRVDGGARYQDQNQPQRRIPTLTRESLLYEKQPKPVPRYFKENTANINRLREEQKKVESDEQFEGEAGEEIKMRPDESGSNLDNSKKLLIHSDSLGELLHPADTSDQRNPIKHSEKKMSKDETENVFQINVKSKEPQDTIESRPRHGIHDGLKEKISEYAKQEMGHLLRMNFGVKRKMASKDRNERRDVVKQTATEMTDVKNQTTGHGLTEKLVVEESESNDDLHSHVAINFSHTSETPVLMVNGRKQDGTSDDILDFVEVSHEDEVDDDNEEDDEAENSELDVNTRLELELDILKGLVRKYRNLIERLQPNVDEYIDGIAADDEKENDENDADSDEDDDDNTGDDDDDDDEDDNENDHFTNIRAIHSAAPMYSPRNNNKTYYRNISHDAAVLATSLIPEGDKSQAFEKKNGLEGEHLTAPAAGIQREENVIGSFVVGPAGMGPGVKGYRDILPDVKGYRDVEPGVKGYLNVPGSFLKRESDVVHEGIDEEQADEGVMGIGLKREEITGVKFDERMKGEELKKEEYRKRVKEEGTRRWYRSKRDVGTLIEDEDDLDDEAIYREMYQGSDRTQRDEDDDDADVIGDDDVDDVIGDDVNDLIIDDDVDDNLDDMGFQGDEEADDESLYKESKADLRKRDNPDAQTISKELMNSLEEKIFVRVATLIGASNMGDSSSATATTPVTTTTTTTTTASSTTTASTNSTTTGNASTATGKTVATDGAKKPPG